jgi:hypothetical protein
MLPAQAGTKPLPECDDSGVEATLRRVAPHIITVIETKNIRSTDPTESRFCRTEALVSNGRMLEAIYELRWTSETDNRYWLQIKGGRFL